MTSATTLGSAPIPRGVLTALGLLGATCLVAVVRVILMNLARGPAHVVFHVGFGVALIAALGSLWIYGLYSRRNWVRWFTIVFLGFGTLVAPWALPNLSDPRQLTMYWIQYVADVPTCILLCLPAAGRWYGRRDDT